MDTNIYGGQAADSRFVFRVNSSTVPRSVVSSANILGKTAITDTSTVALAGDVLRFESGAVYAFKEYPIISASTNGFVLGIELNPLPTNGDTFYILRRVTQLTDSTGAQEVVLSAAPIQFIRNTVATTVSEDTVTPANSRPLPIEILTEAGVHLNPLTDTELRATAVPVSAAALPLPSGAATETTLGTLNTKTSGSMVPVAYDEIVNTYVGATTKIATSVYKLATVTKATLTFSYDGSDRLTGVVRT